MFVTTEVKGTLEVRLQLSKHTQSNACFCFPTNSLFFSLIHTCMPASSVCNSLVNNKKALIVLPRGRSLFPPLGERHPLHLKWLRPSIRTVPFPRHTNKHETPREGLRPCVCVWGARWQCVLGMSSAFLTEALNDHTVRKEVAVRGGPKMRRRKLLLFSSELEKYCRQKAGE